MNALSKFDQSVVEQLSAKFGTSSADVADALTAAQFCRVPTTRVIRACKRLEARGIVKRMDDEYPIAWMLASACSKEGGPT